MALDITRRYLLPPGQTTISSWNPFLQPLQPLTSPATLQTRVPGSRAGSRREVVLRHDGDGGVLVRTLRPTPNLLQNGYNARVGGGVFLSRTTVPSHGQQQQAASSGSSAAAAAAATAVAPSSVALTSERAPWKAPIGVRRAATMTTGSVLIDFLRAVIAGGSLIWCNFWCSATRIASN